MQPALLDTLDIWDEALCQRGALLTVTRKSFVERLTPIACEIYRGISTGREEFSLRYLSSIESDGESSRETMKKLLAERRGDDLRTGMTSVGPHRDDVEVLINGISPVPSVRRGSSAAGCWR